MFHKLHQIFHILIFKPVSIPECIENQKGKKGVNYGQTPASLLPLQLESLKLGSDQLTPNKSAQLSRFTIKEWLQHFEM